MATKKESLMAISLFNSFSPGVSGSREVPSLIGKRTEQVFIYTNAQKVAHVIFGLGDCIPLVLGILAFLGKFGKLPPPGRYAAVVVGAIGSFALIVRDEKVMRTPPSGLPI